MKIALKYFFIVFLIIILSSCSHKKLVKLPPVTDGWRAPSAAKNAYIAQKNDTLYSIAWAFGVDWRYLAKVNNVNPPYVIAQGTRIYIAPPENHKRSYVEVHSMSQHAAKITHIRNWLWPAKGEVVAKFDNKLGGNKGINIAGKYGDFVVASNPGVVVYSGTGIRSYGKLIIIKHNDDYLSAYAYNKDMLVHEGDKVSLGQKIATLGCDDEGKDLLHFEIRLDGKPVDPLEYLTQKP